MVTSLLAFSVVAPSPHKSGFDLRGPHILQCGSCLPFARQITSLTNHPLLARQLDGSYLSFGNIDIRIVKKQ